MRVHTLGHGTLPQDDFVELVHRAGLRNIVDVRSFPGSRRNPQFGSAEMEEWLIDAELGYRWMRELGGRRPPVPDSVHVALRHRSFRAYADHMETASFLDGVETLLGGVDGQAVMCSETVWWRCHRRLLADHLVLVRKVEVLHLMHDGRLMVHQPTDGVRLDGDRLVYDVGATPSLLGTRG